MYTFKAYLEENPVKITANRGDVAEVVLGAAVTARFWKHPYPEGTPVSEADVREILKKVIKTNPVKLNRDDYEVDTKINDVIRFKIGVPIKAFEFIKDPGNWKLIPELFSSSLKYVNADRRLNKQASVLARNGKINDIFVNSDGTGDQKGTKADIKIEVDGKPTRNQISLKVKGGDQFAQVAGVGWEKQMEIWGKLGLDVSKKKKDFTAIFDTIDYTLRYADRNSANASKEATLARKSAAVVYRFAAVELKKKFKSKDRKLLSSLGDFIRYGATLDDPHIELVKLGGAKAGKFKRAKFGKKFYQNLQNVAPNLEVEYKSGVADPTVVIYDKNLGQTKEGRLLQIRAKYSPESSKTKAGKTYKVYLRNIVEAGDLFFELATDI